MKHVVIGRAIKSGLSSMTEDWAWEMRPDKIIIIDSGRGEIDLSQLPGEISKTIIRDRDWRSMPVGEVIQTLTRSHGGCDFVVGFETWYREDFTSIARSFDIATVMFPMWECSPRDVYSSTVTLNVTPKDQASNPNGHLIEWPTSDRVLASNHAARRWPPRRFVCNTGYGALFGRNNTEAFIRASAALEGTGATAIVRCIREPKINASEIPSCCRLEGLKASRRELYEDADVIVCPIGIEGLSLPIWETVANRIPVVVLDLPQYRDAGFPYRVKVANETHHGFASGLEPIARPDVEDFGRLLRSLATGETLGPPQHPRWVPASWNHFRSRFSALMDGIKK
jgi:hypothetical protein